MKKWVLTQIIETYLVGANHVLWDRNNKSMWRVINTLHTRRGVLYIMGRYELVDDEPDSIDKRVT